MLQLGDFIHEAVLEKMNSFVQTFVMVNLFITNTIHVAKLRYELNSKRGVFLRLELCNYSGYKIYPGHGKRYCRLDGKVCFVCYIFSETCYLDSVTVRFQNNLKLKMYSGFIWPGGKGYSGSLILSQVSRLRCDCHACGSKTSMSRLLTPVFQS